MTIFNDFTPDPDNAFANAYTRLVIISDLPSGGIGNGAPGEDYVAYDKRGWFERYFWGTHTSLALKANVTISGSATPYNTTVPLISMDHYSDSSDGEKFTRVINHRAENYPLFLVGQDGTNSMVSVQFDLLANDTPTGGGAANALAIATSAIKLVAPQTAVLNTLTATSTQNVASAVDKAVDQLFTSSIEEKQSGDSDIRTWPPGEGISVKLMIPGKEGDWFSKPTESPGTWTITFDNPQPSVFDSVKICPQGPNSAGLSSAICFSTFDAAAIQAQKDVGKNPSAVLNFPLANGGTSVGTVSAYLGQQAGFTGAIGGFANGVPKQDGVVKLCRAIKSSMINIGLNYVDAGIVVVAARSMSQIPASAVAIMENKTNAKDCGYAL